MTDKADAWMPLWIGAYLADTQMLTTTQHGAYLLLLMAYWRERKALPDDDDALRSIVKADKSEWKKLRPTLSRFFIVSDGAWSHKRVEAELQSADKRRAASVSKAKAAAGARWKQAVTDAPSNAPSTPQAVPEECPTSTSTPVPTEQEISKLSLATDRPGSDPKALALVDSKPKPPKPGVPDCPHQEVLNAWAEALPQMPQHTKWTNGRAEHLRARWRETAVEKGWKTQAEGVEFFRRFFIYVGRSDFLTGRARSSDPNRKPFVAELAWLLMPENFAKTIEGKYHPEAA